MVFTVISDLYVDIESACDINIEMHPTEGPPESLTESPSGGPTESVEPRTEPQTEPPTIRALG